MIWLVWRRNRLRLAMFAGLFVALGVWMVLEAQAFDSANNVCRHMTYQCGVTYGGFSVENQATAINALLLFLPCLAGLIFGAPLVAGELEQHTNRLVWTQGVSRTRWFITEWSVVGLALVALASLLVLITQWWSGQVFVRLPLDLTLSGRIQPTLFAVTGVAPIAYTLFAFSLGAALGAILRRTSWAVIGSVVAYTAVAFLVVFSIRPSLASQGFLSETRSTSEQYVTLPSPQPWNLGYGFRFTPDSHATAGASSPSAIAQRCQNQTYSYQSQNYNYSRYRRCLSTNAVEGGFFYQPSSHYWALQWGEAAIFVAAALVLFGLTLGAVRRWRA
jgi:ABC-type transport system involved in multi-copper enzyme maturation permease subunit